MKTYLVIFACSLMNCVSVWASDEIISLKFNRTGTDAQSVEVVVTDGMGTTLQGITATLASSHNLKATAAAVTPSIVCPNVNANMGPTIELILTIEGLPEGFAFNRIGLDIHALNGGNNYQENTDGVTRQWNVMASVAKEDGTMGTFGFLANIDIAANIGTAGNVHQIWNMDSSEKVNAGDPLTLKLIITKGTTNAGCFFGLSEVVLCVANSDVEPDLEPEPSDSTAKVYYLQWKNTGSNHITEGGTHYLTVAGKNTGKAQFWQFIPSGNENCYYIKNTVTGRYLGSCNLTPSSASRIMTSSTPVEYYVGATAATSGEIVGCHYLSSTDCADYANESAGPRALNKDGASDYVITWQAGTNRVGSYWRLVETTDTFVKPQHTAWAKSFNVYFNPCGSVGSNYLTAFHLHGEGATGHICYESSSRPSAWHIPCPYDKGVVTRGAAFDLDVTLANLPEADLTVTAYTDWNSDGVFEGVHPIALSGKEGKVSIVVPEDAAEKSSRMRIRVNSNGLNLADDDVEGFVYDFLLTTAAPMDGRTVTLTANAIDRGSVELSDDADRYPYGTTLTAKALPYGNATFVCWREEGVVVSTTAEYTFTVDRNVNLKAYFTANTEVDTHVIQYNTNQDDDVIISLQSDNVVALGSTEVLAMSLYSVDAALLAHCCGNTLSVAAIKGGVYIVRATTAEGYKNTKLYINK
ncbi:MAG: hypothetical protein E7091_01530 [Bacteroidales bacterium]|nr:hypothetical protein [Bacteroidales bacterium]